MVRQHKLDPKASVISRAARTKLPSSSGNGAPSAAADEIIRNYLRTSPDITKLDVRRKIANLLSRARLNEYKDLKMPSVSSAPSSTQPGDSSINPFVLHEAVYMDNPSALGMLLKFDEFAGLEQAPAACPIRRQSNSNSSDSTTVMITPETLIFLLPLTSKNNWQQTPVLQERACKVRLEMLRLLHQHQRDTNHRPSEPPLFGIAGNIADVVDLATCICHVMPEMIPLLTELVKYYPTRQGVSVLLTSPERVVNVLRMLATVAPGFSQHVINDGRSLLQKEGVNTTLVYSTMAILIREKQDILAIASELEPAFWGQPKALVANVAVSEPAEGSSQQVSLMPQNRSEKKDIWHSELPVMTALHFCVFYAALNNEYANCLVAIHVFEGISAMTGPSVYCDGVPASYLARSISSSCGMRKRWMNAVFYNPLMRDRVKQKLSLPSQLKLFICPEDSKLWFTEPIFSDPSMQLQALSQRHMTLLAALLHEGRDRDEEMCKELLLHNKSMIKICSDSPAQLGSVVEDPSRPVTQLPPLHQLALSLPRWTNEQARKSIFSTIVTHDDIDFRMLSSVGGNSLDHQAVGSEAEAVVRGWNQPENLQHSIGFLALDKYHVAPVSYHQFILVILTRDRKPLRPRSEVPGLNAKGLGLLRMAIQMREHSLTIMLIDYILTHSLASSPPLNLITVACMSGWLDLVTSLLDAAEYPCLDPQLYRTGDQKDAALHWLCKYASTWNAVHPSDPAHQDLSGANTISLVTVGEIVRALVKSPRVGVNASDQCGRTGLFFAHTRAVLGALVDSQQVNVNLKSRISSAQADWIAGVRGLEPYKAALLQGIQIDAVAFRILASLRTVWKSDMSLKDQVKHILAHPDYHHYYRMRLKDGREMTCHELALWLGNKGIALVCLSAFYVHKLLPRMTHPKKLAAVDALEAFFSRKHVSRKVLTYELLSEFDSMPDDQCRDLFTKFERVSQHRITVKMWYERSPEGFLKKFRRFRCQRKIHPEVWGSFNYKNAAVFMEQVAKTLGPQAHACLLKYDTEWDDLLEDLQIEKDLVTHLEEQDVSVNRPQECHGDGHKKDLPFSPGGYYESDDGVGFSTEDESPHSTSDDADSDSVPPLTDDEIDDDEDDVPAPPSPKRAKPATTPGVKTGLKNGFLGTHTAAKPAAKAEVARDPVPGRTVSKAVGKVATKAAPAPAQREWPWVATAVAAYTLDGKPCKAEAARKKYDVMVDEIFLLVQMRKRSLFAAITRARDLFMCGKDARIATREDVMAALVKGKHMIGSGAQVSCQLAEWCKIEGTALCKEAQMKPVHMRQHPKGPRIMCERPFFSMTIHDASWNWWYLGLWAALDVIHNSAVHRQDAEILYHTMLSNMAQASLFSAMAHKGAHKQNVALNYWLSAVTEACAALSQSSLKKQGDAGRDLFLKTEKRLVAALRGLSSAGVAQAANKDRKLMAYAKSEGRTLTGT